MMPLARWLTVALLLGPPTLLTPTAPASSNVRGVSAPPSPDALRTEYAAAPLGIDAVQPRLSWQLRSTERGARQTAYRVQVAGTEADLQGERLVWDTGRVESDASVHVAYAGPALESGKRYFWRVRIWDEQGEASPWSATAWWEMALLDPSDWEAVWIEPGLEEEGTVEQPSPYLRRDFEIDGPVASARLYATAHGLYAMHLNGAPVSDELFTPGWTSYHERLQYQTFDVTDHLRPGANALGAILGDGWYRGHMGFGGQSNQYGSQLALLAQLVVTYADGRSEVAVMTDDGWRSTTGPILMSDLYMGETYDARLELTGWSGPDYDVSGWQDVRVADHGKDHLVAPVDPPVRRIQTLRPVSIFTTPDGDRVVDMGQNMVGWVRLRVQGPAGTTVTLRHAEVLDREGNFYTENLRAARQTVTYILKGDGEEVFEPHFTFQGFRYVAVDGYPGELTLDDLAGIVIHSDMAPTGHFESSHPLVNQLQHNIVWGQKGNFVDVPTDCPQRDERMGWTGDAQVFAPTAAFNMDVARFYTKWLRDLAADQADDGRIPHVVPDVLGGAGGATGWADAGVIVPWTVYQHYGDVRVLERQYDSMKRWVEYVRAQAAQDDTPFIWDTGFHFGDWLAYSSDSPAYPGATTSTHLIATAYFGYSTGLLAETAALIGRDEDARHYAGLRDSVVAAFQEEFVTPRGRLSSDTQTAYVLALAFDLLPVGLRDVAAGRLAGEVRTRGHLTTGFLGTPQLTHVLSGNGYVDEAYTLLLRTEYPSWLYPVTQEATTIWERWDGQKPDGTFQDAGMNSFNHYAYGAVGDWLYGEVAGIQVAEPGYRRIRIAPIPGGGLTHARARLQSMYGLIESSWQIENDSFRLDITVPPNTGATVRLPNAILAEVREGGRPLPEAAGIGNVEQDGPDVVLEVQSGRYTFAHPSPNLAARAAADAAGEAEAADEAEGVDEAEGADAAVEPPFGVDTRLGALLADPEARALLMERLPELTSSLWLSQAMGFPLARAPEVVPVALPQETLADVDRALRELR
jgi:alpha-L-rhamnosidase